MNKSAARTIDLLEYLSNHGGYVSLSEISKALNLPKSSCHDLVATLLEKGAVDENERKCYKVGLKIFRIGNTAINGTDLFSAAHPVLATLAVQTGAVAYLAILNEDKILYIDKAEPENPLGFTMKVGASNALHCTALGKAMLSALPEPEFKSLISRLPLERHSDYTVTSAGLLIENIAVARLKGYSFDDREDNELLRCAAAPIRDRSGNLMGAVSLSMPVNRFPIEKIDYFGEIISHAALEISKQLGFCGN